MPNLLDGGTYFNIDSLRPQMWPGSAGLAGMMAYKDRANYDQAVGLQQLLNQQKAQEFFNEAPTRAVQDKAKGMQALVQGSTDVAKLANPDYLPSAVQGDIGKNQQAAAQGKVATGTADTDIATKNSDNVSKTFSDLVSNMEVVGKASPMYAQAMWGSFKKSLPANHPLQQLPDTWSPQLQEQLSGAMQNSIKQRQAMSLQTSKNESSEKIAAGHDRAMVQAAQLRASARVKSLVEQFQAAKTPEQMIFTGQMILNDTDVDEPTKKMVQQGVMAAARTLAQRNAKGQIDFANPTGGTGSIESDYFNRLMGLQSPQGGPQSQPQAPFGGKMSIPGVGDVEILGKNPDGSIKFRAANGRTGTYRQ